MFYFKYVKNNAYLVTNYLKIRRSYAITNYNKMSILASRSSEFERHIQLFHLKWEIEVIIYVACTSICDKNQWKPKNSYCIFLTTYKIVFSANR